MIRVVLDTNVLVAAVISPTGPNAQVFEQIVADKLRPYVTNAVIEEYDRAFEYERLRHLDKRRVTKRPPLAESRCHQGQIPRSAETLRALGR